ncbi:MAG: small multi-drug export protein [Parcubacteria group bacterium]|nr:small multi-drug export protein [Parcubacteria group bacterium]
MHLPAELIVFLISLSPLAELRGAIPVAISVYHFSWLKAFLISFLGNIIIIVPIIWFLETSSNWLMKKSKFFNRFFTWIFDKTRKKIDHRYNKYRNWALLIFVAIPLPTTGAWTGSIAAYLLGLSKKESFVFISLGVLVAGCIVTILTLLGIHFF